MALPPKPIDQYTAGEQEFIDQRSRQMCIVWADHWVQFGTMPPEDATGKNKVYLEYAKSKRWVNADGSKILTAGLLVAARFLKR